jgi:hypothetical protein
MSAQAFQQALGRLINDTEYRSTVESNPRTLVDDFNLDQDELSVLNQVYDKLTPGDVAGHMDVIIIVCCCCI